MVLRKPKNWTRYIRRSYHGNLRRHPVESNNHWRKLERMYTTVTPIIASTAVQEAWKHPLFESVPKDVRPEVKRLIGTFVSRTLFSNMTDLPENPSYKDANASREVASAFMPQVNAQRKRILALLGEKRTKIVFKEVSDLLRLLTGATYE